MSQIICMRIFWFLVAKESKLDSMSFKYLFDQYSEQSKAYGQ